MSILNFFDSSLKISSSDNGFCKEFIIRYPMEKGKCINIGDTIIANILCDGPVIVKIDTSLCFNNVKDVKMLNGTLKGLLKSISVDYQYRLMKSAKSNQNSLSKLFQFSNKSESTEVFVFELPAKFPHRDLLETILELGCQLFVPFESENNTSTVLEIFNGYYDDNEDRFDSFKFIMFLNNYVEQAVLRTKYLNLKDVEEICSSI